MNDKTIIPLTAPKKPSWAVPGDHLPKPIHKALSNIDIAIEYDLGFTAETEAIAFKALFQDVTLLELYHHLQKFEPSEQEWRELIDCFVQAYDYVASDIEEHAKSIIEEEQAYYQSVSKKAYELFELLYFQDSTPGTDLHSYVTSNKPYLELLKLVSLSTSAKWPELYYHWLNQEEAGYDNWGKVEELRQQETPWLSPDKNLPNKGFPPPEITFNFDEPLSETKLFTRFIRKALHHIDDLCTKSSHRSFVINYNPQNNQQIPHKNSAIFLEPAHWRALCVSLFGLSDNPDKHTATDQYPARTINSLITKHRKESSLYQA